MASASGTDIPFLFGLLHHIFKNGWEDKQYINDRVYGMEKVREDVLANWTPDDYVKGYMDSGEKTGLVLGEVPRRLLIESRPLKQGEGFEVVYVRQFVERAKVSDLLKFATDEAGRAVPVRQMVPELPGSPE